MYRPSLCSENLSSSNGISSLHRQQSIDGQNLLSENYSYDHDDPQMCNVKVSLFVNGNTPLENRSLNFVVSKKEAEDRISLLKSEKAVINITE